MSKAQDRHGQPQSVGRRILGQFLGTTWSTETAPMHREQDSVGRPIARPKPEIAERQKLSDTLTGRKK